MSFKNPGCLSEASFWIYKKFDIQEITVAAAFFASFFLLQKKRKINFFILSVCKSAKIVFMFI